MTNREVLQSKSDAEIWDWLKSDATEQKTEVITIPNWDDFPNFKPFEFRCRCGKCDGSTEVWDMDYKLLFIAQSLRNKYGVVQISSGYRCQAYNDSLKGSVKNSYHIKKKAMDFYIAGKTNTVKGRNEVIAFMRPLPGFKYAYHNENGDYPNMGSCVHVEVD